ncbi:Gp138 family membrane-puncturing spike protein [Pectobacterium carotovorum]
MADTTVMMDADPAQGSSLAGVIEFAFKKMLQGIDGQLPAVVIGYDRQSNRATVRPLISRLTTQGQQIERATIASVPVLALGGGEFGITFPLKAGDRGWIESSDRDISLFMQSNETARPNTLRMHEFADGRFIPDLFSDFTLPAEHDGAMLIQHKSGETRIVVKPDEIALRVGNASVVITEESINLSAGGQLLSVGAGGAQHNGVNIGATHRHDEVMPGTGTSGTPQ